MNYATYVSVQCLLTTDVIGVDVLDGSTADVCRLSPQRDSPQLIHTTQLQKERENGQGEHMERNRRDFEICCCEPRSWAAVVGAGGQPSQITQMLKQIESRHADRLRLQLRHLRERISRWKIHSHGTYCIKDVIQWYGGQTFSRKRCLYVSMPMACWSLLRTWFRNQCRASS